ncbi:hypothetical protein [Bacillus cereus]|uniref:Uncharacterized protein n=3 Tax=Bacillus cereus TaxID=1396 RepID=A0A9X0KHL7_BACCE|nr:hypothetical protein [Bacillus cereus]AVR35073.1 hypothetical protein FORC60_5268 [Bacillus cereus]KMP20850.1 hypothetical protein TQ94_06380 [Bacillus cereus]MCR2010499.1 hypothetical protein [Bacillus cereus]MDR4191550.1 hypothetical protein [Bacillus cereus]MEB9930224.1 hypothetical protein [Bacillus cereus]
MSLYYLLKRDLHLRLRDAIKITIFLFLIYTVVVFVYIYNQSLINGKEPLLLEVNFYRFFHGVDFVDLSNFHKEGRFSIPFYWIFFQIVPLLLVGNFSFSDIQQNGIYLFPRVKKRHVLWLTKVISLFFYIIIIWSVMYFIWFTVYFLCLFDEYSFYDLYSQFSYKMLGTMLIQIIISFLLTLVFEFLTFYISITIAFLLIFMYLFLSIFFHSTYLLGSFVMPNRWYFVDHSSTQLTLGYYQSIQCNDLVLIGVVIVVVMILLGSFCFKKLDVIGE